MDPSIKAQDIISQATQWNFQGDCTLLQWMKEIAEHLEQKANHTCESLKQLSADVNRNAIALDNATNSLVAQQNTQFVESRCREDDENLNSNNTEEKAIESSKPTGAAVLKSFLQNNIKVLHNCHEKYTLDFEDSDEEEPESSCIYQPKNPYNERLLPHIYGSKLWKENWHVGLCEESNHYSGDEVSETYSISSASPQPCEANDSNSSLLSEWNSSNSIPTTTNNIAVKSAASVQGSEKSLFLSSTLPEKVERDLYNYIENLPPPSIPISAVQIEAEGVNTPAENTARPSLFEDKRNQKLISEIADKVKARVETPPVPAVRKKALEGRNEGATAKTTATIKNNTQSPRPLNLFDTPPGSPVLEKAPNPVIIAAESGLKSKFTASNLFDDDLENDDDFLNTFAGSKESDKPKTKEKISLFDDEEEADLFAAKKDLSKNDNKILTAQKNVFFDTEPPPLQNLGRQEERIKITKPKINLFDNDSDEAEDDFFSTKKLEIQGKAKINIENKKTDFPITNTLKNEIKETTALTRNFPTLSLFPEDDDEDLDKIFEKKTDEKQPKPSKDSKILEKHVPALNLFAEEDDEALDNIFKKKAATEQPAKESAILEKKVPGVNLFSDENDEALDNIFEKITTKKQGTAGLTNLEKNVPVNLFAEEDDEVLDKIFQKNSAMKQTTQESKILEKSVPSLSLFPEENDEALDKTLEKKGTMEQATQDSKILEENVPSLSLFSEQNNEDLDKIFEKNGVKKQTTTGSSKLKKNVPAVNLFAEEEDEALDKIFEKKAAMEQATPESKILEKSVPTLNLFTEEDDDALDKIFEKKTATEEETRESTKLEKNVSTLKLFSEEDDEDLDKILSSKSATEQTDAKVVKSTNDEISGLKEEQAGIKNVEQINNEIENSIKDTICDDLNAKNIETIEDQSKYSDFAEADDDKNVETIRTSNTDNAKQHQYANIFSEEPPDDDFFSVSATKQNEISQRDFFEPPSMLSTNATTIQTENKTKTLENIDYGGFSLISDIPPDDDFLDKLAEKEVQQYDSSSEEAQHVVFTEELKKDVQEASNVAAASKDEADKSSIVAADGRTISKLQMPQIKINVQALLPNATGLSKMRKSLEQQQERKEEKNEYLQQTQEILTENLTEISVKDTNVHILSNVCKGRVRAPLKRRPSTRTARQENYRQTMVAATAEEKSYAENSILHNDLFSVTNSEKVYKKPESNLNEDLFSTLNKNTEKKIEKTSSEAKIESENNMFPKISAKLSKKEAHNKTLNSMDTDDDDDLFFNTAISPKKPTPTATTKALPVESKEISKTSLFDDSDDADFDASLFGATSLQKPKILTTLPQQQSESFTKNKNKSIFFDEDNDFDDDLFKSLKPLNKDNKSITKPAALAIKSSSLFGSDDDDDELGTDKSDNFFAAVKRPTTAKINMSASSRLFDENIDEDDDLFSSTNTTFRGITQKPTTSVAKKNNVKKQSSINDNPLADLL